MRSFSTINNVSQLIRKSRGKCRSFKRIRGKIQQEKYAYKKASGPACFCDSDFPRGCGKIRKKRMNFTPVTKICVGVGSGIRIFARRCWANIITKYYNENSLLLHKNYQFFAVLNHWGFRLCDGGFRITSNNFLRRCRKKRLMKGFLPKVAKSGNKMQRLGSLY